MEEVERMPTYEWLELLPSGKGVFKQVASLTTD